MLILTGEDDLRDVRSAVSDLAGNWKDLGDCLRIRLSDLANIRFPSPSECLREVLTLWLKQCYNVRTTLVHCLPIHIYYTKYTTLAAKQSRFETLEEPLKLKVLFLIIGNYMTVVSCMFSLHFPSRWRNLGGQLGEVWLRLSRTK